jgi:hypothetical protein
MLKVMKKEVAVVQLEVLKMKKNKVPLLKF